MRHRSPRERLEEFSRLDFQNKVDIVWDGKEKAWEASVMLDLGDTRRTVAGGYRPTMSGALIGLEEALRDRKLAN